MTKERKKTYIFLFIVLLLSLLLLGTNYYWYKALNREEETLRNALIPTLSNDYFTNQIALTNQAKIREEYDKEWFEYELLNDEWYRETIANLYQMGPLDVPLILQNPEFPNGCEAASATMILNYLGIPISLEEFIETYLPISNVYEKEGIRYGPNPAVSYAGNPASNTRGWGCFSPVIANAIGNVLKNEKMKNERLEYNILENDEKYPLALIANQTIGNSFSPFIIWITTDYGEAKDVYEWFSYDEKNTYTYPKNSHAVVVTGVDETYYYINDPLKDEKNIPIIKEELEKSFDSLGRQFVFVSMYEIPEDLVNESNYEEIFP